MGCYCNCVAANSTLEPWKSATKQPPWRFVQGRTNCESRIDHNTKEHHPYPAPTVRDSQGEGECNAGGIDRHHKCYEFHGTLSGGRLPHPQQHQHQGQRSSKRA
uniref:Uncharacterized protein n=1 Tax=Arundo donax TaxID=35708 RepID=A0A0A9FZY5_ARUDO